MATAIMEAGKHVMKYNKHVLKVDTIVDGEDMLMRLTVHGHDQWWIKKHIVYPVVGIFTKVGVPIKEVKLDTVEPLPHHQHTMEWKNDPDRLIDHDPEIKVRKRKSEDWHVQAERDRYLREKNK